MTSPLPPAYVTHESLDHREALLLASLQRMGRNPNISPAAYAAAKRAAATQFTAIDDQRVRLLAGDR